MKNLEICPGFIPDPIWNDHPNTIEGTFLHEAMDLLKFDHLTEEQLKLVQPCISSIEYCLASTSFVRELYKEPELNIAPGIKGHVDWLLIQGDQAFMKDWKFGHNKVEEAEHNFQGQAYTLGVFNKFPSVKVVHVEFNQPRLDYVTTYTFLLEDVAKILSRVMDVVMRVKYVDEGDLSNLNYNENNCRLCARANCPIRGGAALTIAQKLDHEIVGFDPAALEVADNLKKACDLIPMLEQFVKLVKEKRRDNLIAGQNVEGYELYEQSGGIEVDAITAQPIINKYTKDIRDFYNYAKIDMTGLKKLIRSKVDQGKQNVEDNFIKALAKAKAIQYKDKIIKVRKKK